MGGYLGTSFPLFHVLFAAEDASEIMNVPAGRPIRPQCSAGSHRVETCTPE